MDTVRGAAVLGVVVMHAELEVVAATGGQLPVIHAVNELLGPWRMPALVLLSGLLLPRSLAKGLRRHLRGKAAYLLWPYAVWASLDFVHVQVDAFLGGTPLRWDLLPLLLYDPHTYLWFLAYLFAFHVVAGFLPPPARTLAVPLCFWVAIVLPGAGSLPKFLTLLGWFLVGDLLARGLAGRVPLPVVRASSHVRIGVLAAVGRSSVVYYACHLLVLTYAVRALAALGLVEPRLLWLAAVLTALGAAAALDRARSRPEVAALFAWPAGAVSPTSHGPARLHVT